MICGLRIPINWCGSTSNFSPCMMVQPLVWNMTYYYLKREELVDWWSNEICSNSIRLAQLIASRVQTLCASFAVKQMLLSSKVLLIMIGQQHEHFTHNWLRLSSSLFTNFHSICCVCTSTFLGVSPPLNSTCKFSDPFAASTIQDLKLVAVCDQWLAVVVDLCL